MTDAPTLKPCPFCGGEAQIKSPYTNLHRIECKNCNLLMGPHAFLRVLSETWNTRAAPKVKALEWDKHPDAEDYYGGSQDNLVGMNEYEIFPHPCAIGLFVLDVMGNRCETDFYSVEAAKSAAKADYERRILDALE